VAVVNLTEGAVERKLYKLPFPNIEDNPSQLLLEDAKDIAVLWPKEFVTPE
jgi:hypothetical protein